MFAVFGVEILGPWRSEGYKLYTDIAKPLFDVSRDRGYIVLVCTLRSLLALLYKKATRLAFWELLVKV